MRKLYDLENLIRINRYANCRDMIKEESVADHVVCMNALALEYIPIINDMIPDETEKFSLQEIIYAIAIHDIDEAFTTDLPKTFKHANKEIEQAVHNTTREILKANLSSYIISEIDRVEDKTTPLGVLLKIIDVGQSIYKMASEIAIGNSRMRSEINNALADLEERLDWLQEPCSTISDSQRKALRWLCKEFLDDGYDSKRK